MFKIIKSIINGIVKKTENSEKNFNQREAERMQDYLDHLNGKNNK